LRLTLRGRRWEASLAYAVQKQALPSCTRAVGVDLGVRKRMTLSNGAVHAGHRRDWREIRRLQRKVSRCKRGSKNRRKAVARLARFWRRESVRERNACHRATAGIINNPDTPITREHLVALNEQGGEENVSTGYHAIEFLLWGQDLSADGPGSRPASDYEGAPRRAQYLHTVAAQLVDDLQYLVDAWAPGQNGNYRTVFLAQAPKEALRQILVGVGTLSRSELAGERMAVALESQDQEDEHSCFSDNTHDDIIRNAQGIQNVIQGRYVRGNGVLVEGPGILSLLQDDRRAELEGKARNAMAAAHTIMPPFDNEITSPLGRQRVLAAIHALRAQAESIVNAAADLGIPNLQVELPE